MTTYRPRSSVGFGLIELLIGIAIFAILFAIALPTFSRLIADVRVRNQSEHILAGLQQAKGEALKRNSTVRFQLVTTLDSACVPTAANSNLWLVSHGDPTARCHLTESILNADVAATANAPYATPPVLLIKGTAEGATTAQTSLTVTAANVAAADPVVCFNGTGRLNRVWANNSTPPAPEIVGGCTVSMHPANTSAPSIRIDITDPSTQDASSAVSGVGLCFTDATTIPAGFHANGSVRCQRIMVSPAGEIRMCDPGLAPAKHPNDPRVCS
jgi:type IV fimbrial biogenesis protein FimT